MLKEAHQGSIIPTEIVVQDSIVLLFLLSSLINDSYGKLKIFLVENFCKKNFNIRKIVLKWMGCENFFVHVQP